MLNISRKEFIKSATVALIAGNSNLCALMAGKIVVGAHLWVYASQCSPTWDCTPIIENVFSDLKYAGIDVLFISTSVTNIRTVSGVKPWVKVTRTFLP